MIQDLARVPHPVKAAVHFRRMRGGSYSHLIMGDDQNLYVVKFLDNPQHRHVLANEWLATHLAEILALPVPHGAIVDVSQDFVRDNPTLTARVNSIERPYAAGLQFGSRFMGGTLPGLTVEYLPAGMLSKVSNCHDFLGALIFDKWTCNADGRQAVFVTQNRSRSNMKAHFIDHGFCFNSDTWRLDSAPLQGLHGTRNVYHEVRGIGCFEPWLAKLRAIDSDLLWRGFQSMPQQWYEASPLSPAMLIEALDRRRHRFPDILIELKMSHPQLFPLWI